MEWRQRTTARRHSTRPPPRRLPARRRAGRRALHPPPRRASPRATVGGNDYPARLGTTLWHIWAFGTWRDSKGYYQSGPDARSHLGAAYVWHVGGTRGLHTRLYPNGRYQYCVQALTDNGVRGTRCTAVAIQN